MNREDTTVLARAVRNWNGAIAEITLVWRPFYSKLGVEYRQVADEATFNSTVPDWCVKNWMWIFVRPQGHLQPDSYYITQPVTAEWADIITIYAVRN